MRKNLTFTIVMTALLSLGACDAFVASGQLAKPGVNPEKPFAETEANWNATILVTINDKNEIWIDEQAYGLDEISAVLKTLKAETPEATAVLIGDADASSGMVYDVQTVLQDLEIPTRVSVK